MSIFSSINLSQYGTFAERKFKKIQEWINGVVSWQSPIVLTDAASISWDPSSNYNAKVTLAGSRALVFPSLKPGAYGTLEIIQGGSGSYTLTLPAQYTNKVANSGSGVITLSTTVGSIDVATFYYNGSYILWTISNDFT